MLLLFPAISILCSIWIFYVLGRPRYLRDITSNSEYQKARISIVIPARNEANNIPALLDSLEAQRELLHEIIVVDDSSTDGTAEQAKARGSTVLTGKSLVDGWKGKPWACHQGGERATGDWLLFVDADVRFHAGALEKLHSLVLGGTEQDVYSIYPHHRIERTYEQLSAYFNSLMVAGINAFGFGKAAGNQSALFGQTLLISKTNYLQIGGHSSAKDKVLENFHLAETLKQSQSTLHCLLGKDLLSMRMFPDGFLDLWQSWKKGFVSGAAKTHKTALLSASLWISGGMFCIVSLCLLGSAFASPSYHYLVAAAYGINVIACLWAFRLAGSFSFASALCFPISLLFYQTLFFSALIDKKRGKKTNWKGRLVD